MYTIAWFCLVTLHWSEVILPECSLPSCVHDPPQPLHEMNFYWSSAFLPSFFDHPPVITSPCYLYPQLRLFGRCCCCAAQTCDRLADLGWSCFLLLFLSQPNVLRVVFLSAPRLYQYFHLPCQVLKQQSILTPFYHFFASFAIIITATHYYKYNHHSFLAGTTII